jgi:hypothetical protein
MSFARIVGKKNWQICASRCAGFVNMRATVQMPTGASVNHCRSRNRSAFPVDHGVWCLGQAEAEIEKSQEKIAGIERSGGKTDQRRACSARTACEMTFRDLSQVLS